MSDYAALLDAIAPLRSYAARCALAHALVQFGHEMGCTVVAEGVEAEAERATLEALQVPLAQGYLFSRPMPVVASQQLLLGQREAGRSAAHHSIAPKIARRA